MRDDEREFVDGFLRVARAAHPGFWIQGQWDVRCAEDHSHKSGFCGMGKTAPVGIDPTYRWNIAFRDGVDLIRADSDSYGFMVDEPDLEFIVWCANHRNQIANALEAAAALTYHFPSMGTQTPSLDDVHAYITNRLPHHRNTMEGEEKPATEATCKWCSEPIFESRYGWCHTAPAFLCRGQAIRTAEPVAATIRNATQSESAGSTTPSRDDAAGGSHTS